VQAHRLFQLAHLAAVLLLAAALGACAPTPSKRPADQRGAVVPGTKPAEVAGPLRVAVILPEDGQHLAAATAIRDGVLAAYYARPPAERPELRFYAAPAEPYRTLATVQEAAQAGAAVAIGPLDKSAVAQLASSPNLPIPVLALNRADSTATPPPNLYQFALAPEAEAMEVAERAWADGHRSASLITPAGSWGDRVQASFRARWEALGGQIGALAQYDLVPNDLGDAVAAALGSDAGRERHAELQRVLGRRLEYTAAGGGLHDGRCVFVAGTAPKVRELRRLLAGRSEGGLALYGTSSAWTGDLSPETEAGLAPIRVPDMPWLVADEGPGGVGRTALAAAIPASARSPLRRLYPMGIDSLNVLPHLERLRTPGQSYDGQTGNLSLDSQRRLYRRLVWVELSNRGVRVIGYESPTTAWSAAPQPVAR